MPDDTKIPITVEFDDRRIVGYVVLTEEYKKIFELSLIKENELGSQGVFVLSPGYITDFPDDDGAITKAELFEFGIIPASRAYKKENNNG